MSGDQRKFWGLKTLCVITGASKGIGRGIALEFSKKFAKGSKLILMARSEKDLQKTAHDISHNTEGIEAMIEVIDLSKPELKTMEELVKTYTREEFDKYILVHNAGSEGDGDLAVDLDDLSEWQSYMALNLYSVTMLTSAFLKSIERKKDITILNITSLAAIEPIKSMGYYCVGKGSREIYLKVLAEENPDLDILNYSPGPVKTDMIDRVILKAQDEDSKNMFISMKTENRLLAIEETVSRLVALLESGGYKSGSRVDYFDSHHNHQ